MGYGDHGGFGMMGVGWIGTILFWILLVLAVIWLWRALDLGQTLRGSRPNSPERETRKALDIAKERYAKGEIGKEEFEQLKQDVS